MSEKQAVVSPNEAVLEAMIQYNNSGFHRHTLREIGLTGAFVEMGNVRVLRRHAPVKLVFVHHDKGANYTHLIHARVQEISKNGAHLIFSDLDRQACDALQKLEERMAAGKGPEAWC
jgi:hypothetical protein